jgi:predicted PhzF superfamily epimerase YddE/YHI9
LLADRSRLLGCTRDSRCCPPDGYSPASPGGRPKNGSSARCARTYDRRVRSPEPDCRGRVFYITTIERADCCAFLQGESWVATLGLIGVSNADTSETSVSSALRISLLRVFANEDGRHGNRLGVVDHTAGLTAQQMIGLTRQLDLSETVLLGADYDAPLRIFNPVEELPFAGHPMVGVAWLLGGEDRGARRLVCGAGACEVQSEGDLTWITAPTAWAPNWESIEYQTREDVDRLIEPPAGHDFVQTWAWIDEADGRVRARVFAPRVGIPEDEACGSASLLLADRLGRDLLIEHGNGSRVYARSLAPGLAQVGGRVVLDEQRVESMPGT